MLTASGATHQGRVRRTNEDAWLCDVDLGLFVVADGMGGHNAGEVASKLAIETIRDFVADSRDGREPSWPFEFLPGLARDANRLLTSMRLANRRVFHASEHRADYSGMGTTVVAALIHQDRAWFSSVGDSRIYAFRGGALSPLTHDDSWVATVLARERGMDEAALARHPMRHLLTKVIGARDHAEIEISDRRLEDGESLFLCSDGLHGAVDGPTMCDIVASAPGVEAAARALVATALERSGADNITAVIVRYDQ